MDNEYYELLNLQRTATKEQIKKAYKEIARKNHPDKGGDPERFKKINEAYGVLSDDNLRSRYDRFGKNEMEMPQFPDFFNMFPFQMNRSHMTRQRTPNRNLDLALTMEESFQGAVIKFRYKRKVFIGDTNSSGCTTCNGSGKIIGQIQAPIGIIQNVSICHACAGVGVSVSEDQFQTITEIADIHIPPCTGVGKQIVLHGKSDEMPKIETGDLVLTIVIKKHPVLELVGRDLLWNVIIHPFEALTYFSRSLTLPSNEVLVISHQPNDGFFSTLHNRRILQGKGLFDANQIRGDLLIQFILEDFYIPERDYLYQMYHLPVPSLLQGGIGLDTLPLWQPQTTYSHPQQAQQPHVQECRPS